jgi:hypothetical protein
MSEEFITIADANQLLSISATLAVRPAQYHDALGHLFCGLQPSLFQRRDLLVQMRVCAFFSRICVSAKHSKPEQETACHSFV